MKKQAIQVHPRNAKGTLLAKQNPATTRMIAMAAKIILRVMA